MASGTLAVWLGKNKDDWEKYAEGKGYTPSALAAIVLRNIVRAEKKGAPIFQTEHETEFGKKIPVQTNFTLSELAALDQFASFEGKTRQKFIIGLFRSFVANEPQYTDKEVIALRESNRQLRSIGSNLNMIARALNQNDFGAVIDLTEQIAKLRQTIDEHTRQVGQTINPSAHRYQLKRVGQGDEKEI